MPLSDSERQKQKKPHRKVYSHDWNSGWVKMSAHTLAHAHPGQAKHTETVNSKLKVYYIDTCIMYGKLFPRKNCPSNFCVCFPMNPRNLYGVWRIMNRAYVSGVKRSGTEEKKESVDWLKKQQQQQPENRNKINRLFVIHVLRCVLRWDYTWRYVDGYIRFTLYRYDINESWFLWYIQSSLCVWWCDLLVTLSTSRSLFWAPSVDYIINSYIYIRWIRPHRVLIIQVHICKANSSDSIVV